MSQFKISTRLAGLLTALCLLVLLVGAAGLFGMGQSNAGLKSVYDDRVVPLKQIKVVADMYAVNVVDAAHKVRDGAMTPAQGLQSVADARKAIESNWPHLAAHSASTSAKPAGAAPANKAPAASLPAPWQAVKPPATPVAGPAKAAASARAPAPAAGGDDDWESF